MAAKIGDEIEECAEQVAKSEARRINATITEYVDWQELLGAAWEGCRRASETYKPGSSMQRKNWMLVKGKYAVLDYLRTIAPIGNRRGNRPLRKHSIEACVAALRRYSDLQHTDVTKDPKSDQDTRTVDLEDWFASLPKRTALILKMRLEGHAIREIAARIGISESSVSQIISEAKKTIRGAIR